MLADRTGLTGELAKCEPKALRYRLQSALFLIV